MKTVLTTTAIPERKRAQYWQDAVCDTFVELDCEVRADRPFFGELATTAVRWLAFLHTSGPRDRSSSAPARAFAAREKRSC